MFFKKHLTNKSKDDSTTTETSNNNTKIIESPVAEATNLNSNTSEDDLQDQYLFSSSILFNKFKNQNSGPDVLYENEAWGPENEYVGLFRKRRVQVEEQTSSTSDPE